MTLSERLYLLAMMCVAGFLAYLLLIERTGGF